MWSGERNLCPVQEGETDGHLCLICLEMQRSREKF